MDNSYQTRDYLEKCGKFELVDSVLVKNAEIKALREGIKKALNQHILITGIKILKNLLSPNNPDKEPRVMNKDTIMANVTDKKWNGKDKEDK